ncbi:hypothetical protein OROMI_003824 [Orobanche minor]
MNSFRNIYKKTISPEEEHEFMVEALTQVLRGTSVSDSHDDNPRQDFNQWESQEYNHTWAEADHTGNFATHENNNPFNVIDSGPSYAAGSSSYPVVQPTQEQARLRNIYKKTISPEEEHEFMVEALTQVLRGTSVSDSHDDNPRQDFNQWESQEYNHTWAEADHTGNFATHENNNPFNVIDSGPSYAAGSSSYPVVQPTQEQE